MQDIAHLYAEMQKIAATDKPRIQEHEFIKYLLPLLVNIDDVQDLDVTVWLDIAGNPHREIDVVDNKGVVLFTVPPMLARTPSLMPEMERTETPIGEILAIYGAKQTSEHPAAADAYLNFALRDKVFGPEEEQMVGFLKTWVTIYNRYEIPLDKLLGEYAASAATKDEAKPRDPANDISDELLDFD